MQDQGVDLQKELKTLAASAQNPAVKRALQSLGKAVSVGNVTGSTGVAIGENIRLVVNQLNLPAEAAARVLDVRHRLAAGLVVDVSRYRLDALLVDRTRDFVGREHVFEALEAFLRQQPCGYFTVVGDPGVGKSAILAEYTRRTGCLAHFNVRPAGITTARQFLENLCSQLIVDYGLPHAVLPADATQDGAFLSNLLTEASAKLATGARLIIAVDALDEVELSSAAGGANILYLPPDLPPGVYWLLSRRRAEVPLVTSAPRVQFDLRDYPAENRRDVERYLTLRCERPKLKDWLKRQSMSAPDFVDQMAERSQGNFMYLRHVVPEIEQGAYQDLKLERLPADLEGYYDDHWSRMGMRAKPLPRLKISILYLLCELHQPASRQMLAAILQHNQQPTDEIAVQEILDEWSQFLHAQPAPEGPRYSLYHASFRDFLYRKDIVRAARVNTTDIRGLIGDFLFDDLMGT